MKITKVYYDWIQVGNYCVFIGDIADDADEKAIEQQIYAEAMGWTEGQEEKPC